MRSNAIVGVAAIPLAGAKRPQSGMQIRLGRTCWRVWPHAGSSTGPHVCFWPGTAFSTTEGAGQIFQVCFRLLRHIWPRCTAVVAASYPKLAHSAGNQLLPVRSRIMDSVPTAQSRYCRWNLDFFFA